jgi:hypothetical protein
VCARLPALALCALVVMLWAPWRQAQHRSAPGAACCGTAPTARCAMRGCGCAQWAKGRTTQPRLPQPGGFHSRQSALEITDCRSRSARQVWTLADPFTIKGGTKLNASLQLLPGDQQLRVVPTAEKNARQASYGGDLCAGKCPGFPLNARNFSKLLLLAPGTERSVLDWVNTISSQEGGSSWRQRVEIL